MKSFTRVLQNVADTAGLCDIPDPSDIPGGALGQRGDIFRDIFLAERAEEEGIMIQKYLENHNILKKITP